MDKALQLPPPPPPPVPHKQQKKVVSIQQMVRDAYIQQASDIHIRVGELPRFRIRGQMEVYELGELVTPQIFAAYLDEILTPLGKQQFAKTKELDTAIVYPGFIRCRVNCFETLTGGAMVLRLITLHVPSIDNLGLPPILKNIINKKQGLVLVTGPTGSGKSTTIAAMIRYLNETAQKHIVTIEDPIEYVHTSQNCLISQREVGLHTHEFHEALRSVLREDPDVILIGEMRDRVTVDTALKAAQTGHLVLGTLHSQDSIRSINRLLNLYKPDEQPIMRVQIVDSLVAVINQNLLATTDGGRTAAMEILLNTPTMQDYLLKGEEAEAYDLMEASSKEGMKVMNDALCELMLTGQISIEDAFSITQDVGDLRRRSRNEGLDPSHSTRRDVYTTYSYSSQ
ncbi:PilT/PilU family type 4a pilus ATPase [Calothrix sp. FACHB-1219]|uniref:type IV pilus twitching motility protein PilT n=1 Tax=unclassified Calothrix TaxID=2619626 RepID=UPI001684A2F2|nr:MULTISPECIES: PilT/PilU family type 4a pilus ATPase [unclassified Calothrix]MBD2206915.1 PilT/PilU family type 4a pilus ATPase [Calothrix sp. FACHB-168]MBD2221533.1 PilT/PilU family type 4a pilus ATPase [Calothrix sp. FACHB-1219]